MSKHTATPEYYKDYYARNRERIREEKKLDRMVRRLLGICRDCSNCVQVQPDGRNALLCVPCNHAKAVKYQEKYHNYS